MLGKIGLFLAQIPKKTGLESSHTFLGIDWLSDDFYKLLFRFFINLLFLTVVIRYIYYKKSPRKDYLFTFYMISIISFMICFALKKLDIDTGMGLGLFAIFGIIRYRTNTMKIREMTYLFIAIGLSVVNALAGKQITYLELFFMNISVAFIVYIMEYWWLTRHETSKTIIYEKIENIKPENYERLKLDLEERTGLKINKVQIGNVDFLKDTAEVKIFYMEDFQDEFNKDE